MLSAKCLRMKRPRICIRAEGLPEMSDVRRLPTPVMELWEWQHHGACRGRDSKHFFHPDGERGRARQRRENRAKAICAHCPVVRQCADHALQVREPYGIWGGLGEGERQRLISATKIRQNEAHVPTPRSA